MFYTELTNEDIAEFFKVKLGMNVVEAKIDRYSIYQSRFFKLKVKEEGKFFKKKIKGFASNMCLNIFDEQGMIHNGLYEQEWSAFMLEKFGDEYFEFHKAETNRLVEIEKFRLREKLDSEKTISERIRKLTVAHQKLIREHARLKNLNGNQPSER